MPYFAFCRCEACLSAWGTEVINSSVYHTYHPGAPHHHIALVSIEWNSGTGRTGPTWTHLHRTVLSRRLKFSHYKVVLQRLRNSSKAHTTGLYSV